MFRESGINGHVPRQNNAYEALRLKKSHSALQSAFFPTLSREGQCRVSPQFNLWLFEKVKLNIIFLREKIQL